MRKHVASGDCPYAAVEVFGETCRTGPIRAIPPLWRTTFLGTGSRPLRRGTSHEELPVKIEHFVLADQVEWVPETRQFRFTSAVPSSIRLLNPSPGSTATLLMFQFGVAVVGLIPGQKVSATIELTHEKGTQWARLGEREETLGPTDTYWIFVSSLEFPPAREGLFKLRLTVRSGGKSQRVVKKIDVAFTPAN